MHEILCDSKMLFPTQYSSIYDKNGQFKPHLLEVLEAGE